MKPCPQGFLEGKASLYISVILCGDLEVALGMVADGADIGSLGADDNVAAVPAFPDLHFALLEHLLHFNVLQQGAVTFLMMLFDGSDAAEFLTRSAPFIKNSASFSAVLAKSSYMSVHS